MTDNGLAALAKAIHLLHHHVTIVNGQPSPDFDGEFAAAILGERGVFLPTGLEEYRELIRQYQAEIATLRAALDGLVAAVEEIPSDCDDNYCFSCHDTLPCAHDDLSTALATAKEAGGG
jgi:hypothetical protein